MSKIVLALVLLAITLICGAQNNQFSMSGSVVPGAWGIQGSYNRQIGNHNLGINGNVGSHNQWGVGGSYGYNWNGGRTSLGVSGGYQNGGAWNVGGRFTHRFDDVEEEADSEFIKSVWKKIGPTVRELGKNYLRSKGVPLQDDDEMADFIGGAALMAGNPNNRRDEAESEFNPAFTAVMMQQRRRRDEADEDDSEADIDPMLLAIMGSQTGRRRDGIRGDDIEESDSEFIKSVWKKVGPAVREMGKNYLRSKGIPLEDDSDELADQRPSFNLNRKRDEADEDDDDDEESDFNPAFTAVMMQQRRRRDESDDEDDESADFNPAFTAVMMQQRRRRDDDADELADEVSSWQGQAAANWAWSQIGKRYSQSSRYGPSSFDCSGLINRAYASVGVSVPSSTHGYPSGMRRVSEGEMRAGDILYKPGHVAMYAGNGQVVHAANSKLGVVSIPFRNFKSWWGFNAIYRP